jgi:hypothetical protein
VAVLERLVADLELVGQLAGVGDREGDRLAALTDRVAGWKRSWSVAVTLTVRLAWPAGGRVEENMSMPWSMVVWAAPLLWSLLPLPPQAANRTSAASASRMRRMGMLLAIVRNGADWVVGRCPRDPKGDRR